MSYKVKVNDRIIETFRLARIKHDNSRWIPIDKIKSACEINVKDPFKPIHSQYVWFCLDNASIRRKLHSGKIFTPTVCFNPVYLDNKKKFVALIEKAMKKILFPQKDNFPKLVGRTRQSLDSWLNGRAKIPLTSIMKACQILKRDIWKEIDGEKLYTGGKPKKNCVLFRNKETNEIREIVTWIKAEGYLHISSTEVNLVQSKEGRDSLEEIVQKIAKNFHVNLSNVHISNRSDKPNAINITISSAPLRQILCLKYGIPIGFKSYDIDYSSEIMKAKNREEKYQLLSKMFESEGSFGFKKSINLPDFHIVSASIEAVKNVNSLLRDLGYNPYGPAYHHSAFKTGITNIDGSVKFCYDILPYFKHKEKIRYILFGNNNTTHGFLSEEYIRRLKNRKYETLKHWLLIAWIHDKSHRKILESNRGLSFKHVEEVLNDRTF